MELLRTYAGLIEDRFPPEAAVKRIYFHDPRFCYLHFLVYTGIGYLQSNEFQGLPSWAPNCAGTATAIASAQYIRHIFCNDCSHLDNLPGCRNMPKVLGPTLLCPVLLLNTLNNIGPHMGDSDEERREVWYWVHACLLRHPIYVPTACTFLFAVFQLYLESTANKQPKLPGTNMWLFLHTCEIRTGRPNSAPKNSRKCCALMFMAQHTPLQLKY